MARRVARSSGPASKPRTARKKNQKRGLDAFTIAQREVGDTTKIRRHRLGEAEDENPRRKRQRVDDDNDDSEDGERPPRHRSKSAKGRFDELDVSEGSDSEGNTWRMGEVDEDDDSDIDSDEAFDESDEERFADFSFRGSSTNKPKKSKSKAPRPVDDDGDIDLDEAEESGEQDSDDDSLGSEAVDLAQMLDDYEEEQNQVKSKGKKTSSQQRDESDSDQDGSDEDDEEDEESQASDFQMSDGDDDDRDEGKLSQLQDFISTISQGPGGKNKQRRVEDVHEGTAPSEFGVAASQKLDIGDLLAGTNDPNAKKIIKMLKDSKPSNRKGIPGKLEAPLPKRQQDKLDRSAANEKAKETLERWVDTVKQNRRAEHISFPIRDPDAQEALGTKAFLPISTAKPANDLESAIQSIMEESGLSTGKKSEEQIAEFEELQTNKMPIEEVMARRAELRKARDLMFREEVRAKRLKKIKSKSYRRVHRKERERLEEQERQALAEAGVDISDEERERNDRRRAEERMGAKHRESKWAKGVKATGRAAWDDDARDGLNEMARRNEELRRRIDGKDAQDEDDGATDLSSDNDDDDDSDAQRLKRQLDRVDAPDSAEGGLSKLAGLKFMQRAEAAQKARNDEDIERMRRELAAEDGEDEDEDDFDQSQSIGRKVFGPSSNKAAQPTRKPIRNEFEEQPGSDDEADADGEVKIVLENKSQRSKPQKQQIKNQNRGLNRNTTVTKQPSEEPQDNMWLAGPSKGEKKSKSTSRQATSFGSGPTLDVSASVTSDSNRQPKAKAKATEALAPTDADGWTVVTYRNQEGSDEEDEQETENPFVLKKESLVEKAFAGDEVAESFETEKRAIEKEEGDKVIDNTLPGWGSWAGDGLSKRDKKRTTRRFLTTEKGVDKDKRKDAKLKNVIVNEKRVKKNAKYMASALPFPHESKQVYESTLRRPLGPEFNTKQVYQDSTKPRVMVKPGVVIRPLSKPLV
ncbi:small nucleolar ribonucleoprotein complex subunit utp14 [Diplodia corticola]|uniref:Small nucleolar ribonucleoprotein complex subunit utp14 n=1 Tax=Diplodia corticola TaxID=236234 RepID=A0A1J9S617_9PEZI|nr:small nucleolar ribonucleoprotein complex subunit utp14 [Diplodia corticola]OJD40395.1 small nucleolar ribonucleoprotein complex subunit utp14 [Diplodia corticola]